MFSISNDELNKAQSLGDFILCPNCGERHIIQYGDKVLPNGDKEKSNLLAFYKCRDKTYLVGVNGKNIMKRFIKEA